MEPTPAPLLDPYLLTLLAIMLAMGTLAGIANYFLAEGQDRAGARAFLKYLVLGIVAALTVPLFLNMASSNLIEMGRNRVHALFVFAGFCLVYVLLSRRLFEGMAHTLMQWGQAQRSSDTQPVPQTPEEFFRAGLSGSDIGIMRAVAEGGSVYENLSDLMENPPSKEFVNERLTFLRRMGLLELRTNEQNVLHMGLSARGAQLLAEVSDGGHA